MNIYDRLRKLFGREILKGIYLVVNLVDGVIIYVTVDEETAYRHIKQAKERGTFFVHDFVITNNEQLINKIKTQAFVWPEVPGHVKKKLRSNPYHEVDWKQIEGYLI